MLLFHEMEKRLIITSKFNNIHNTSRNNSKILRVSKKKSKNLRGSEIVCYPNERVSYCNDFSLNKKEHYNDKYQCFKNICKHGNKSIGRGIYVTCKQQQHGNKKLEKHVVGHEKLSSSLNLNMIHKVLRSTLFGHIPLYKGFKVNYQLNLFIQTFFWTKLPISIQFFSKLKFKSVLKL